VPDDKPPPRDLQLPHWLFFSPAERERSAIWQRLHALTRGLPAPVVDAARQWQEWWQAQAEYTRARATAEQATEQKPAPIPAAVVEKIEPVPEANPTPIEPVARKRGGQPIEFPHLEEVLDIDLQNALTKNPGLFFEKKVDTVIKGLRQRGVEVADEQDDTIGRRIKAWQKKKNLMR